MNPPLQSKGRAVWKLAGIGAAYFFAHELSYLFPAAGNPFMAIWPAGGIGLAAFLLSPRRRWSWVALILFVAGNLANVLWGRPWAASLGFMTANVLESFGAAWVIARLGGERVRFTRVIEVTALLVAIAVVNSGTALLGAATAAAVTGAPFWSSWRVWWVADGMGLLLIAPLVVAWADFPATRWPRLRAIRSAETGVFLVVWSALGWLTFNHGGWHAQFVPPPYLMVGLVVWGALRLGPRALTMALVVLAIIIVGSDAVLVGPLPWGGADLTDRLLLAQAFLGVTTGIGLLLAASTNEGQRDRASSLALKSRYQSLLECANDGIHVLDAEGRLVEVNETFCRMLGYTREELLGMNVADFDAQLSPEELRTRIALLLDHAAVFETVHRRKDGSLCPVEVNTAAVTLEGRRLLYASSRDIAQRKQIEEALRVSEERYRQVERAVNDGMWDWNVVTDEDYLSPRWKEILGYTDAELPNIAGTFFNNLHPDDREKSVEAVRRHFEGMARYEVELRLRHKDGGYRWVLSRGEAVRDAAGRPIRMVGSIEDITERKQAEAALRESEEKFAKVFHDAPVWIAIAGIPDGLCVEVNDHALRASGYTREEAIGRTAVELGWMKAEDRDRLVAAMRLHGKVDGFEMPFYTKAGRPICGLVTCRLIVLGGRRCSLTVTVDISAHKAAELALNREQSLLNTLVATIPDIIYFKDLQSRFVRINEGAARHFGLSRIEDALGKTDSDIFDAEHARQALADEQRVMQTGETLVGLEEKETWPDGRVTWVSTTKMPLRDAAGRIVGLMGLSRNTTESRQALAALRESEEKFATVFRDAPMGMAIREAETGRYLDTNACCLELTGYSREEVIGRTPQEIGFWMAATGPDENGGLAKAEGSMSERDIQLRHKSGRVLHCFQSSHAIQIGNLACVLSITLDITARKQADAALRESQAMLMQSQKVAALGSYVLDFATGHWQSSAILDEIFGIDAAADRTTGGWVALVAPDDRAMMADYFAQEVVGRRRPFDKQYRIVRANDGVERWVQGYGHLEIDAQDQLLKMRGTIQDVTERTQAERALRQSEERYRMLVELSPESVFVQVGGLITFANRAGAELVGASSTEALLGMPILNLVHPDSRDLVAQRIGTMMARREVAPLMRLTWRRLDGARLEVMVVATPMEFNGQMAALVVALDVTTQVQAETELRKLSRAVEQSPVTVVITDVEGVIEYVNPSFTATTGYTFEEARGLNPRLLRSGELPAEVYAEMWRTITAGQEWRGEFHNRKKNGELFWEAATISPIADEQGNITHFLAVKQDITEQKQSETALATSEERFRSLVESVPNIAVQGYDRARRVLFWNAASESLYGYSEAEVLGRQLEDLIIPPEMREGVIAAVTGLVERDESIPAGELTLRRKDGSPVCVYSSHVKLERAGGEVEMHCIDIDLTARKAAEQALAASHDFHERILSHVPALIWRSGPEGRFDWFNKGWIEFTGRPAEEQIGDGWLAGVHPGDGEAAMFIYRSGFDTRLPFEMEYRLRRADGEWRTILGSCVPFTSVSGDFGGFLGYCVDITERRRADARIREQAALLDVAQDAIFVTKEDRTVTYWNRAAERIYEIPAAEACGQVYDKLVYRKLPADFESAWQATMNDGAWTGERQHYSRSGRRLDVQVQATVVRNSMRGTTTVFMVVSDITETKKLEAQFLRAQRMESLGALASGVAHDLNNVLTPILMSVEMLRPLARAKSDHDMLQLLNDSARRGADIVQQLLLFGRGSDSPRAPINLAGVVKEVGQMMRQTFPKNLVLSLQAPADLRLIEADRTQVHQVLLNLCVNARDAMPHGGRLSVLAENRHVEESFAKANGGSRAGDFVRIEVKDSGKGIAAEHLEKIFDPFFTTKPIGEGTGLGLATVLGVVRSHGGFLVVNSQEDVGTVFEVYLPVARSAVEPSLDESQQPALMGQGEWILVVDDEEWIRSLLQRLLTRHDYRVLTASDGAEGLGVYAQNAAKVALVIGDVMMPVMDGQQMMSALRRLNPSLPFVAMSGLPAHRAELERRFGSSLRFLPKPFPADLALRAVREGLELSRAKGTQDRS